jgi:hypothetical protein
MFEWAWAFSLVLSSALTAYLLSVFLGSYLPSRRTEGDSSAVLAIKDRLNSLSRSLWQSFSTTHLLLATTSFGRLVRLLFDILPLSVAVVSSIVLRRKVYVACAFLIGLGIVLRQQTDLLLGALDGFYSCFLSPVFNNFVFVFLHLVNVFYGALVPLWNLVMVILRQVLFGTLLILSKCQTSTLTVSSFVLSLVEIAKVSIVEWLRFSGFSTGVNGVNNFFVNRMRWEAIVEKVRTLMQFIPETLSCVCSGNAGWLQYVWKWLSFPLFTDELDHMVSNAINVFVAYFQTLVNVLPPFLSYPDFSKSFFHIVSLFTETGRLLDKWIVNGLGLIMKLFKIANFNVLVEVPELFLFGTLARFLSFVAVAINQLLWMAQHLLLPFDEQPISNTAYMRSIFSLERPMAYLDAFVVSLFSSLNFMTSTLVKLFVLISAMGPQGCSQYPKSCHFYLDGSCAVYCQSRSTIVFKEPALHCPYDVNSDGRFAFNLEAIEALDLSVFEALDSFEDGFVTLQETRACVRDWDSSETYRYGEIVAYGEEAYFCRSSRCFYTSLQPQLPSNACGSLATCWQRIAYGADALRECPRAVNQTLVSSFEDCRQMCNATASCKAFQHFSLDLYKSEKESVSRSCGLDTSLASYLKCDFPQCELFDKTLEPVRIYLTTERRPTVQPRKSLPKAFVYAEEGTAIKNNTLPVFCRYEEQESIFCIPQADGMALDRFDQFQEFQGYSDPYYTYAYKSDDFTTEQETFLPLEREILSVAVMKTKQSRYSYTFSRRLPSNRSQLIGEPLQGEDINQTDFRSGAIRKAYKALIDPDDHFNLNSFLSCTGLSLTRAFANPFFILYEFLNELVWELIIGGSINAAELSGRPENLFIVRLFDLFYKYDGPWYSRDEEPPCNPPLPIEAKRIDFADYADLHYNPYCGQPNLQFHFYSNLDRAFYFLTSILEKRSFGKLTFNFLRFFPEFYRVLVRFLLDLQSTRFVRGLSLFPFGCGQVYGYNKTGDCTSIKDFATGALKPPCPIGFPSADCTCRVEDPLLDFNTTCACIWLPSAILDADLRQTTSIAVSHWCGVNMLEWPLIFLSRINDALKRIVDSLQDGNKQFPVNPDLCKVDETNAFTSGGKRYDLLEESLVDRVFGGVVSRDFDRNVVESCDITAEHDFACSLASTLERAVRMVLTIIRKVWRNSVSIVSLQPQAVDIDLTSEICNLEKVQAALASTIVEIAPGFSNKALSTRKGITSLIYSFFDILGVVFSEVHVGLLFVRSFLSGDVTILEGGAQGNEQARALVSGAEMATIFYGAMSKFVIVVTTFLKQLFESLAKIGNRDLFLQVRDIIDFVEQLITGGIIPIVAQVAYLGLRFLGLLFTPHLINASELGQIITQTLDLIAQVVTMLLSQAMRVLGIILKMMGSFGQLIGSLLGLVCKIQGTLSDITFGAWEKMDCSGLPSLRRRALAEEPEITQLVYEQMSWDGPSFCDHLVTSYRGWKFDDMRPLEQLRFQECVEWRLLGEEFRNRTGLLSLPHDLLYNWRQPPLLAAKGLLAGFLYARWWMQDGRNVAALKQGMEESGLPARDILRAVHLVKKFLSDTVTRKNAHELMMNVFREHDKAFEDPASNTSTRKAYEVYDAVSTSVFGIYDIVSSAEFQHNLRTFDSSKMPSHGFELGIPALPSAEVVFSPKALTVVQDIHALPQTFGRVYTDLECKQTDDQLFCFECALLDNHLVSAFEVVERTGDFYENSFTDDFLIPFNDSWTNASSYNRKYRKAYESAQADNEAYGSPDRASEWSDWVTYSEGLFVHGNRSLSEFVDAVDYWFQGNFTGEVPANASLLFPASFQEVLELPFQSDCTTADFLWKRQIRSPFYGLLPFFVILLAFEILLFFALDLGVLLKLTVYMVISLLGALSYLVVVYDYNPLCFPQVPTYLLSDFLLWLENTLFVSCSCGWFPFLAKECDQQTCYACQQRVNEYYTCEREATGMRELGQFWHLAFFLRWQARDWVAQVASVKVFPFTYLRDVEGLSMLLQQAVNGDSPRGIDIDCFWLSITLPLGQVLLIFFLSLALAPILSWALTVLQEALILAFHVVLSTLYMAYAASRS